MTGKDHNKLLGIFHLIQGGLQAFGGILVALIYGVIGGIALSTARHQEEQMMGTVFVVLAVVVGIFLLALGGVNLMAGYKMIKEKPGARTWGIVSSIVCLLGFPLGTALGIYGLWFFMGDEGKNYYLGGQQNAYAPQAFPPPPPNHWQ